jgi:hypothetical protein
MENTEQEKKLDQVRKLLGLAKSDNVNEASNAAAAAQRLMSQYSITQAMIAVEAADGETEIADSESVEKDLLHRHAASCMPSWKINLASGMCRVNQCRVLIGANYLNIVGRPSDAQTTSYLFSYVVNEIDRLTKQEAALYGSPGKTWCNNFRLGAVESVVNRMREAANDARKAARQKADTGDTLGTGASLVLVNRAIDRIQLHDTEAQRWVDKHCGKRKHHMASTQFDSDGRNAGRRAGASIDLAAGGRAPLSSGSRAALNR